MPDFVVPPIDSAGDEQTAIQASIEDTFADRLPGWEAQDGTPERALIEGVSIELAENRRMMGEMLQDAARWLASSVFGLEQHQAIAATGTSTWTLTDDDGHLIPAGTQITVAGLDGSRAGFEVVADVTVTAGNTTTTAGEVQLIATAPGADSNGLQADAQLESFESFVDTITITAPTAGGVDAEDDQAYLDRFVRFAQRFSPRLVLPDHFVLFALDWVDDTYGSPVERAIAYDTYDGGGSPTPGHTGELRLGVIDSAGADLSGPAMAALEAALEAEAISGFQVHVVGATRTTIDVDYTITVYDTFDPVEVLAAADAAVEAYLSPATWGIPPYLTDTTGWIDEPVVDIGTLEGAIVAVEGVHRATVVELNGGTSDVALTGKPGLPEPGTITGSVA